MSVKKDTRVAHVEVSAERAGQRLDNFVSAQLPGLPRSLVYRIIRKGQVRVNGGRCKPHTRLSAGDMVRIPPARVSSPVAVTVPAAALELVKASIYHEQDEFMLLDKPAGIAVHGGSGVRWGIIDALRSLFPGVALELVHRLDRETSGCLLVAKTIPALRDLREQFRDRNTEKRYLCLTQGRFREDRQLVDEPIGRFERGGERFMEVSESGKKAVTEFRLLEHYGRASFVEALPLTGRTHQIRVHAAFLGIPLAGDKKYSSERSVDYWRSKGLDRLFLHAHGIAFEFPAGERQQFNISLPADLNDVLNAI